MKHNNIFTSDHWHKNDLSSNKLIIVCDDEQPSQAKFTLDISKKFGFTTAEMAGEPIIQYNDIADIGKADINQCQTKLTKQFKASGIDLLHFRNVKVSGNLYKLIQNISTIIAKKNAPYIDLEQLNNIDDYLKTMSSSTRKSRRRTQKKLNANYDVNFQILTDKDIDATIVDDIIKMKNNQLALQGMTSRLFMNSVKLQSLKNIITTPNDTFKCIISTLKCDGVLAAAEIGFLHQSVYYSFLGAMNEQYKSYSPGSCQLLKTIEWAIDNGVEKFDLLAPEDHYKTSWSNNHVDEVVDLILPLTLKGNIWGNLFLKTLRPMLKNAYFLVKNTLKKS